MINLVAIVENGEIVRRGLQDLEAEIPKVSRLSIYRALLHVLTRMRKEPPRMAAYSRTGIMRAGWPYRPVRVGNIGYSIYNAVAYTMYVVGDSEGLGQAWFHVGRWEVFRDAVEEELAKLPEEAERLIELYAAQVLA